MSIETVYITGAGSGIGLEVAQRYANKGCNLALFDLKFSHVAKAQIQSVCFGTKQKIAYYEADVTHLEILLNEISKAESEIGLPSIALHCAGVQKAGVFETVSADEFEKVISINLFGSRNFAQGCVPLLKRNDQPSRLVFVASFAGLVGPFAYASYASSKFGVVGLAQVLRMELAPENVKVQVICPPEVDTPMVHEERRTIHPVTAKLKDMTGTLSIDQAVNDIMRGLNSSRFYIIPGRSARITYWMNRLLPVCLVNGFTDWLIRKELKRP